MPATEFEFKYRFFAIGAIYAIGFSCYAFDHVNVGVGIARLALGHAVREGSAHDRLVLQCVFGFGALLAIAAAAIRTWGAAYLKSEIVHDLNLRSEALVADGPYRYVRNPLYLGGVVLAAGIGFMASQTGIVALVVLHYLFYMRLIGREETQLLESQGERYVAYCRAVPRFWPALWPRVASGKMEPRWRQAFLGEAFLWCFAGAAALFAVTLNQKMTWMIIDAVLLGYGVVVFGFRRRRKAKEKAS